MLFNTRAGSTSSWSEYKLARCVPGGSIHRRCKVRHMQAHIFMFEFNVHFLLFHIFFFLDSRLQKLFCLLARRFVLLLCQYLRYLSSSQCKQNFSDDESPALNTRANLAHQLFQPLKSLTLKTLSFPSSLAESGSARVTMQMFMPPKTVVKTAAGNIFSGFHLSGVQYVG